jgi:protease-4
MTPEERRTLQALLDDVHAQFIDAVAKGRRLDRAEVVKFADGRVFSGVQAKDLHMVDALGSLEDAVNEAAKLAGMSLPPAVSRPSKRFSVFDFVRSQVGFQIPGFGMTPGLPTFRTLLYMMD